MEYAQDEIMCFILSFEAEGASESEQRSEKPSVARIRNRGRGFMVGGSGDGRGDQKKSLARLVFALRVELSLAFDVPLDVDVAGPLELLSSCRWITCGSAVI